MALQIAPLNRAYETTLDAYVIMEHSLSELQGTAAPCTQ